MTTLKVKAFRGALWSFLTQFSDQLLSFSIQIVLARLLLPIDFGTVALLSIFLSLSKGLSSGGFAVALIQKKDADELDFSSVFFAMLALSGLMYALLFVFSAHIAVFYDRPELKPILRVLSIQLIFAGFNGVQQAHLIRHLKMKLSFFISLPSLAANGVVGIWMALHGFGPWALVGAALSGGFLGTVLQWFLIGWRPRLQFSFGRLKSLFSFGSRLLCTGLLETFSNQIYGLIIGKWYSPGELAYFNRGDSIPHLVLSGIQGPVGNVAFPVLSQQQDDCERVRQTMRKMLRLMSFLVFPCLFGLAAVSESLVRLFLTDKWIPAVPYMRLACVGYAFGPIYMLNSQAMNALGRSDLYLRLEVLKKVILFAILFATIPFGPIAMSGGKAGCLAVSAILNAWPNRSLIRYSFLSQIADVFRSFLLASVMAVIVWCVASFGFPSWKTLLIQLSVGGLVYVVGAFMFRVPGLDELLSFLPSSTRDRIKPFEGCFK